MIEKCVSASRTIVATDHAHIPNEKNHRISTNNLTLATFVVNTLSAAAACYFYPAETLIGGMAGAMARQGTGDTGLPDNLTEDDQRASRVALMSSTALSALYTAKGSSNAAPFVAGYAGYQGISNGVYPLLRKLIG